MRGAEPRACGWRRACSTAPLRAWQRRGRRSGGMVAFFLRRTCRSSASSCCSRCVINFVYSVTGGTALFLARPHLRRRRALRAPARLRATTSTRCTCREDQFWTAVRNTARFVVLQVALMIAVALVTALILNRDIRGPRLLARRVLLPGPAVAGRRRPDLALDPAARGPAQLHASTASASSTVNWLTERSWAFAAAVGVSVWAHMGFYTLILLAGLQAIPQRPLRGRRDGRHPAGPRVPAHHPAAALAEPARRHRAGADPRRADLRRGLRADRRRPGHLDPVPHPVHLRDRLRLAAAQPRPRRRRLDPDGRRARRADPDPARPRPAQRATGQRDEPRSRFLTRRRGGTRLALDRHRHLGLARSAASS